MKIISDPDLTLIEPELTFNQLELGDMFRFASTHYMEAIKRGSIFMKIHADGDNSNAINLHNGVAIKCYDSDKVIVHDATLVVIPNI